ncbi:glycosidase-like protein [Arthrobacter sp. NEB 688]|uniref:glycoside hydrolase family 130 protein n=1 Tax=Arthrobacter sp. NEB 688 TaxID=904039 RepID=UPI001C20991E|nr:glycosidase-like protein [Arthrobacter sp. NEB 688]
MAGLVLRPDPARVVSRLFLPGQELGGNGESRSAGVVSRILALPDDVAAETLARTVTQFTPRHHDLEKTWNDHFGLVRHRLPQPHEPSAAHDTLIGAYFTQEFAIEGAALCNPSLVLDPDQTGLQAGTTRYVMSVRAIGEGHLSSIEWREVLVEATGEVTVTSVDARGVLADVAPMPYSREVFRHQLEDPSEDGSDCAFVLSQLPAAFTRADLDLALSRLHDQRLTRGPAAHTAERFDAVAASCYAVEFPRGSRLGERVLMPRGPREHQGMEDLRLVRMVQDGAVSHVGTYTAWDGHRVASHLLRTTDFRTFEVHPLSGPGAHDKGLAVFPRRIDGRYVALSRADRESNGITTSADLVSWDRPRPLQTPHEPWEVVQLGNCGSPIETPSGWLTLTHGVGAMREYSIGALLLDLQDPTRIIGRLRDPLLSPTAAERNGYVPNVVYSCGAALHGETLLIPYGCSDQTVRLATVDLALLLAAMT